MDVKVGVVRRWLDPVVVSIWLLMHRRRPIQVPEVLDTVPDVAPAPVPVGV